MTDVRAESVLPAEAVEAAHTARLADIKERVSAATSGPWRWRGNVDNEDPYLVGVGPGMFRYQEVLTHIRVERKPDDRRIAHLDEYFDDPAEQERARQEFLVDEYGIPRSDERLAYCSDGLLHPIRDHVIFEVCPEATERSDPRVYRADVVGVRHPDYEFIAHSRADVEWLLAEVDRLSASTAPSLSVQP